MDLLPDYPPKPRFSLPRNVVYVRLASEGAAAPLCGFEVLFSDGSVVQLGSTPVGTAVAAPAASARHASASAPPGATAAAAAASVCVANRVTTVTYALASDEYIVCVFGWQSSGSLLSLGFVTNQRRVFGPVGAPPARTTRRRRAAPPEPPSHRPVTLAPATTTTVSTRPTTGSLPTATTAAAATVPRPARRRARPGEAPAGAAAARAYNFQYVAAEDEYLHDLAIESTLRTVFNVFAPRSAVNAHVRARWAKVAPPADSVPDLSEDDEVGNGTTTPSPR